MNLCNLSTLMTLSFKVVILGRNNVAFLLTQALESLENMIPNMFDWAWWGNWCFLLFMSVLIWLNGSKLSYYHYMWWKWHWCLEDVFLCSLRWVFELCTWQNPSKFCVDLLRIVCICVWSCGAATWMLPRFFGSLFFLINYEAKIDHLGTKRQWLNANTQNGCDRPPSNPYLFSKLVLHFSVTYFLVCCNFGSIRDFQMSKAPGSAPASL